MERRDALKLPMAAMLGAFAGGAGFASPAGAAATTPAAGLQPVIDYLAGADAIADRLGYTDPRLRPAFHQHVLMLLSLAYIEVFAADVAKPTFLPYIRYFLPWGSPNPDDDYRLAAIEDSGVYRLFGVKGSGPVATVSLRNRSPHLGEFSGRTIKEIDLNSVAADAEGRFSLIVSASRPQGYDGAWVEMPAGATSMLYRSRLSGPADRDPQCLIERLDTSAAPAFPTPEQVAAKTATMVTYATRQIEFLLGYLNKVRERGGDKGFIFDAQTEVGGLLKQKYLMYCFDLAPDEAILIETEVPEQVAYWSVQVFDAHFSAVDYIHHQSSLNGVDVKLDADGRARLVVAASDPGSANWLDTGGWPSAGMLWRWNDANRYPLPATRIVKLAEVSKLLPEGHPMVTPAERKAELSARAAYEQTRGR